MIHGWYRELRSVPCSSGDPDLALLEVVLYDGDEVLRVDDALEGRAADDGLVGEDLDGAGAGGGGMLRQGGRSRAVARLLKELLMWLNKIANLK